MNVIFKIKLATLVLSASFILNSCKQNVNNFKQEQIIENIDKKVDNKENTELFYNICDDLYEFLLSKNHLDLHFMSENTSDLGISNNNISFEEISIKAFENNFKAFENFDLELKKVNPLYLNKEDILLFYSLNLYLKNILLAKDLYLNYEPLALNTGLQTTSLILLSEYPLRKIEDVENYLSLLSSIDEYYKSLIDFEKLKKENKTFLPKKSIELIISSLNSFSLEIDNNFMQTNFANKLDELKLNDEQKNEFIKKHNKILLEDFFRAYEILKNGLTKLNEDNTQTNLVSQKAYINHLIQANIYPSYNNLNSLKLAIEKRIKKDALEISSIITKDKINIETIYNYKFENKDINYTMDLLKNFSKERFPQIENLNYEIKDMPKGLEKISSPAFYLKINDAKKSNIIYIDTDSINNINILNKLAHEAIPGHMYQNTYYKSKNHNKLWNLIANQAYLEGFAVYAESLSFYADPNLSKNMARVLEKNFSSKLALYALLDLEINYYEKDKNYIETYLKDNYNIVDSNIVDNIYYALIANPCNYLKYYVGYLEIIEMKEEFQKKLKENYSEPDFHSFILDMPPAPFSLIKKAMKTKLKTN